nr:hypothetical protein [Tanacetum cinerariifolium]
ISILSQENPFEIITRVVQDKMLTTYNASLVLEDFDPPLYELSFFKEAPSIPKNLKTHAEGFCPPSLHFLSFIRNHCTLPTQGMGSIISMVSISPEGFMPSILLMVVVIVTVVIVAVILVVVAINGVVIVVMIIGLEVVVTIIGVVVVVGGVSFIIKLSLVIIGFLHMIVFCYLIYLPLGYVNGFL